MCGIVGYIGTEQAAPIILDGLSKLEYRGYDSAGMAIFDGEKINTKKAVGRLKVLENLTHGGESMKGTSGIGHTRWATHGAPSDINSHPHMNNAGTIAVVHNGIIENYIPLKKKMQDKGYQFISETDTEVLAHLLDYYYKGNPLEAITKVLHRVEGSYALGIMFADQPDKIFAARKDSPLIVGKSESGSFIASDVPAILKYTRTVYYVDNQEVVELKEDGLRFFSVDEEEITKTPVTIDWDANAAEKGGYEHFMLKEIYEQPKTINDTISPRIKDNDIVIEELNMSYISREEIREYLGPVYDLERLIGRITYKSANPRDLIAFRNSLKMLPFIRDILKEFHSAVLKEIHEDMDPLQDLYDLIERAIVEEPPIVTREGGMIKEGYNEEADKLRRTEGSEKHFWH